MATTRADINPAVLRWARSRGRLAPEELAYRLRVSEEQVSRWEAGERKPTLRQLYRLSEVLHLPAHAFYASEPPSTPEPLAELRRLPGRSQQQASPELADQVSALLEYREVALSLYADLGEAPPSFDLSAHTSESVVVVARRIRDALAVDLEDQVSWHGGHEAFRRWRTSIERVGALVFTIPSVSLEEMRGIAIWRDPLPLVGVNSKDSIRARVFTAMHEFVHLVIRDPTIHGGAEPLDRLSFDYSTERFCNAVAAEVLAPESLVQSEARRPSPRSHADPADGLVTRLARQFSVSKAMMVRRLGNLGLVSREGVERLAKRYDRYRSKRGQGGDFYATQLSRLGGLIPRLAFESYYARRATASDLSSIFGTKVKNLPEMEKRVRADLGPDLGE